jgi:hypothetical protein
MENNQNQLNINLSQSKIKPIFADEVAIALRIKAFKNDKGKVEKEAHFSLIFIDMMKQQPIGEFVINRTTAKAFAQILVQNITELDKQLANKEMPKAPEVKTTTTGDQTSYR